MTTYVKQGRVATLLIMAAAALALAFSLAFASPAKATEPPVWVGYTSIVCVPGENYKLYVGHDGTGTTDVVQPVSLQGLVGHIPGEVNGTPDGDPITGNLVFTVSPGWTAVDVAAISAYDHAYAVVGPPEAPYYQGFIAVDICETTPPADNPVIYNPEPVCPQGQVGTPPNCTTPQPPVCPEGQTGTPPNCTPVVVTPPTDTTPVVTPPPVDTTPVVVPPPVVTIDPPIVVDPPKPTLKATPKPKAPVAKATRTGNRVAVSFKVGDKRFAGRTAIVKIVSGKKVMKTVTIRLPAKSKTTKVKLSSKTVVNGKVKVVRRNVRVTKPAGVSERIIILPAKKLGKAKTLRVSVEMKATPTAKSSKPATRTVRIIAPRK